MQRHRRRHPVEGVFLNLKRWLGLWREPGLIAQARGRANRYEQFVGLVLVHGLQVQRLGGKGSKDACRSPLVNDDEAYAGA